MSKLPKDICSGNLRIPVSIEENVQTPDGAGGFVTGWTAKINPLWTMEEEISGNEGTAQSRIETNASRVFWCRYVTGIVTTDRLVCDGENGNIRRVENVEKRNIWLRIVADFGVVD